ncbi:MAG: MotA/TolQ/ExbB proton channel family protein, partial [Myxococcota bacterium]|nr:MotA/TolQ/ExbB proton channel family protein [Myxococcota bacterium]
MQSSPSFGSLMNQIVHVYLATSNASTDGSMLSLILDADIIVQGVLLILLLMSVCCWVIIFKKLRRIISAQKSTQTFVDFFWNAQQIEDVYNKIDEFSASPVSSVFSKGYMELKKLNRSKNSDIDIGANIERSMRRATAAQRTDLESTVIFLATTGSTAPFIGLFGTVWGILRAFQKIGETGQASIQTVGPDIAHALIATAVG